MDRISVIVPIYNVEKYLVRCIESILNQTYKNLEIILVDDGSSDQCPGICDEYARRFPQIRVIHKKNGGLSDARNCGVEHAQGDYIGFVDGDDFIKPDMYEKLYNALKRNNSEMAVCGIFRVDTEGKDLNIDNESPVVTETISSYDFMRKLVERDNWYYIVAVTKLYSKKILDQVKFPTGKIHEDEYTIHLFVDCCKKITVIRDKCYCYVRNPESITGGGYQKERLMGVEAMLERIDFFLDHGYEEFIVKTEAIVYYGFKQAFLFLPWKANNKYIKYYLKKYKYIFDKIKRKCGFKNKDKMKRYIMIYFPWLYWKLSGKNSEL